MASNPRIRDIFKNQTIFLTGGTGFLGKVLMEKLLRECGDLRKIYVLMRPKKGKNVEERYKEIFEQPCFEPIKSKKINVRDKVSLVAGDCEEPFLGIGAQDLQILKEETNFVIHAAANVRFDQNLKTAAFNIRATRDLLEIAKEMPNLKAYVHVSTAYSNCVNVHIQEKIYEPPASFETLLNLVEAFDEKVLEHVTPVLLGKWPNTYVYSKCISENLVKDASKSFPTAIVRPAILMNSAEEPVEGWIDNLYGPLGVSVAAGYGLISSYHAKNDVRAYLIPVDYCCNCVLAALWKTVKEKSRTVRVYNYVRYNEKQLNWRNFVSITSSNYWTYIPNNFIWYNTFTIRENKLWHDTCIFLLHTVPSYLIDGVLQCLGKPLVAVKGYKKINRMLNLVEYFCVGSWTFDDDNVSDLWSEMSNNDRELFRFRNSDLEWKDFLTTCAVGVKRYMLKEEVDNSLRKHVKLTTFMLIHYGIVALFWFLVYKVVAFVFNLYW